MTSKKEPNSEFKNLDLDQTILKIIKEDHLEKLNLKEFRKIISNKLIEIT